MLGGEGEGFSRAEVEEQGGSGKSVDPIAWRHGCLEQEGAHDVVSRTNGTFSFSILRRSVWAGKTHHRTEGKEEIPVLSTIKLTSVVALDGPDRQNKMRATVGMKVTKNGRYIRFLSERKSPSITCKIINYQEIVLGSGNTRQRCCPKRTMQDNKSSSSVTSR